VRMVHCKQAAHRFYSRLVLDKTAHKGPHKQVVGILDNIQAEDMWVRMVLCRLAADRRSASLQNKCSNYMVYYTKFKDVIILLCYYFIMLLFYYSKISQLFQ